MESLKIFAQECSNCDLGLTLGFYDKVKFAFCAFIWEEFMDFVNKYNEICEHENTFLALEVKIILCPVAVSLIF